MIICGGILCGTVIGWIIWRRSNLRYRKKTLVQVEQINKICRIVIAMEVLGLLFGIYEYVDTRILTPNKLERKEFTGTSYQEQMQVEIEGIEDVQTILVDVPARTYTKKQANQLLEQAYQEVMQQYIGNNLSAEQISQSLVLAEKALNGQVKVRWEFDRYDLITTDGEIRKEHLGKEKELVNVTLTLSAGEYQRIEQFPIMVCRPPADSIESIRDSIQELVDKANKDTATDAELRLPEKLKDRSLIWIRDSEHQGEWLSFLGVITGVALYVGGKEEDKKNKEKYHRAMLTDYPQIISTLSILITAGVPVKGAWRRIACQYAATLERPQGNKKSLDSEKKDLKTRPGYQEILRTYYEMEDGVGERQAYENFGNRNTMREYRKLSMLLIQNMSKGMIGLADKLEKEEQEAFEARKMRARRMGEEAGTRLLLPMMLLLGIVIVILVVPAMLQMQV